MVSTSDTHVTGEIQTQAPSLVAEPRAAAHSYSLAGKRIFLIALLGILAVIPYIPVFVQPFLSDDYIQLDLGRKYGPVAAWESLIADPLYRCRATSIVLTHWTEQLFGTSPLPFYTSSVLIHVINTFMVLLAGWRLGLARVFQCVVFCTPLSFT